MHDAPASPPYSMRGRLVASYIGSAWTALIGLALLPLYVRYLGIESYGLIGFFATLQLWLSILDFGLATTLSREAARFLAGARTPQDIRDLLRSMELVYAGTAAALAVIVIAASGWIATEWLTAKALDTASVTHALKLMGVVIAIQWMGTLYRGGLVGLQRQVWLSGTSALFATVKGFGSLLVLMLISPTVTAFFLFHCAVAFVESLVLANRLHSSMPPAPVSPRFNLNALARIWQFAGSVTVIGVLGTVLTQVDKVLLAKMLPLDEFGYFMLTVAVAGALSMLVLPIMNVAFPRFGELASEGSNRALNEEFHRFAQLLSLAVIPASLLLALFAEQIMQLWTGDPVIARSVAPPLRVWILGTALNCMTHIPHLAQLAHGWTRLAIGVNVVSVAGTIVLLLAFVPRFGVMAAAWIWVGVNTFYILVAIPLMHRRILQGELGRWVVADVGAPGAAAALTMFAAINVFPGAYETPSLGLLVASGAATLVAAAAATKAGWSILALIACRLTRVPSGGTP